MAKGTRWAHRPKYRKPFGTPTPWKCCSDDCAELRRAETARKLAEALRAHLRGEPPLDIHDYRRLR